MPEYPEWECGIPCSVKGNESRSSLEPLEQAAQQTAAFFNRACPMYILPMFAVTFCGVKLDPAARMFNYRLLAVNLLTMFNIRRLTIKGDAAAGECDHLLHLSDRSENW